MDAVDRVLTESVVCPNSTVQVQQECRGRFVLWCSSVPLRLYVDSVVSLGAGTMLRLTRTKVYVHFLWRSLFELDRWVCVAAKVLRCNSEAKANV